MKSVEELNAEYEGDVDALRKEMEKQLQLMGGALDLSDLINTIHNRIDSVSKFIMAQMTTDEELGQVMQEMQKFLTFDKVSQMYITLSNKVNAPSRTLIVPK